MDTADVLGLLRQHRRFTSRLAGRLGRGEAEDLASEAVARCIGQPAPDGRQAPWIERIFRNLVVDRARRIGRVAAGMSIVAEDEHAPSPEDLLLEHERRDALTVAIPEIPPHLRDALVGRFYEDRDYNDVAATSGITVATARTRVHRALARLRVSLGRLRTLVPTSFGFETQSIAVAVMPAVLSVGLVLPALIAPRPAGVPGAGTPVVVAQSRKVLPKGGGGSPSPVPSVGLTVPILEKTGPSGSSAAPPVVNAATTIRRGPVRAPPSPADVPAAVQRFDFGNDEVVGELKRPDDIVLSGDPAFVKHVSLIEIPRSFEPAIAKMLEDI